MDGLQNVLHGAAEWANQKTYEFLDWFDEKMNAITGAIGEAVGEKLDAARSAVSSKFQGAKAAIGNFLGGSKSDPTVSTEQSRGPALSPDAPPAPVTSKAQFESLMVSHKEPAHEVSTQVDVHDLGRFAPSIGAAVPVQEQQLSL